MDDYTRNSIRASVSCNLDDSLLQTLLPLFEQGKVEAIEWSFDTLFNHREIPDWFVDLLREFSEEERLVGHGVFYSLFSGRWTEDHDKWLAHLKKVRSEFHFDHITEHFGFMTGADFHHGAPLGVPLTPATLALGQDRLMRIADASQRPVGLENLAFAYSIDEVKRHGEFLEKLLQPVNGFLLLDLHNLYCQSHNFQVDYEELIALQPLDRVREIHISGGSWDAPTSEPDRIIRRDTHDDSVPDEVFRFLENTIPRCPKLKYVVLEQVGWGLHTPESQEKFRQDFGKMEKILENTSSDSTSSRSFQCPPLELPASPKEDESLHRAQRELSDVLENAEDVESARKQLSTTTLGESDWQVEQWPDAMLETAMSIARKWKDGMSAI